MDLHESDDITDVDANMSIHHIDMEWEIPEQREFYFKIMKMKISNNQTFFP